MEKFKLPISTQYDEILDYIMTFDEDQDSLTIFMIHNAEDYGVYLLTLLNEIARKKNTSFWYRNMGVICSSDLAYVVGSQESGLFYFIKAHELDLEDTSLLNAILDFSLPPEIVLTENQKKYYATRLLDLEPNNERALAIVNSNS